MIFRCKSLVLILVLVWSAAALAADAQTAHLVLLHVNDVHGQTLSRTEEGKPVGGYARLSTAVAKVRDEVGAANVLLLHAGDEFSRGDAMTTASAGASSISLMNQIGFSLFTPGNGDFYGGASNLQKRIGEAKFPVLASNVSYRLGGDRFANDSCVLQVAGVRVGFMGLCFLRKEHPSSLPLKVEAPADTAKRIVPELRTRADLVVALDHIGLDEDRKLAAEVPGIDIIVGGHSHSTLPKGNWVSSADDKRVLIAQAGEYLRYLGRIDVYLTRDAQQWTISDAKAQLIALDASVPEDPAIKAMIARMWPSTAEGSSGTSSFHR
jgi:2',3'-cyclic-nucleotide 2'-phosphodiesterase (5'-nucleotidase family)